MNKPYVKEFGLNEKGETIVTNPIGPEGYLNQGLNRRQRRNLIKAAPKFSGNNRKNRFYYQDNSQLKTIETPILEKQSDGEVKAVRSITTKVRINTSIKHRLNHLRKPSVS